MKWYKYDIRNLSDAEYGKWYSLMSEEKQRRVDRFRRVEDRKRIVAGEMLARISIAEWCGVSPESIIFSKHEFGKPFAVGLGVEFNISHSGNMVVCAIDDKPVGIDIEIIRPIDLSVAKRIFTQAELFYLFQHPPTEQDFVYTTDKEKLTRFFENWTAKEAYGKCLGNGLEEIKVNINKELVRTLFFDNYVVSIYSP